jgi:hypothetical protein
LMLNGQKNAGKLDPGGMQCKIERAI